MGALIVAYLGLARQTKATSDVLRSARESMERQDQFTFAALDRAQIDAKKVLGEVAVHSHLQRVGLMPYLSNPAAAVQAEIEAVQRGLGISRDDAILWLRQQILRGTTVPPGSST